MAKEFQIKRGNVADLPALAEGEPGFTLDSKKLYIGHPEGNVLINPDQFVMTVTYDPEGGNNNTIDKTFAELEAAYQAGRHIRLVDASGMEYELLAFVAGYMAYFSHQLLDERYILGFRANNTVTLDSVIPFTTNNPPNAIQVGAKGSNNVSYTTGSIKTWAKNQQTSTSIGAHRNVTDLPETGSYWIVDLTISNSGMWRKLTATKCNTDGSAHTTYECTCMENTWSEWKKVGLNTEDWTFTLEDGSTVTKKVYVG